jgi:hypothetical protein
MMEVLMKKEVWVAGLWGALILFVWLFISNAVIPFKSSLIHRTMPNQLEVLNALKASITEPGTYSCPYGSWDEMEKIPDYRDQPIFSITYNGYTHNTVTGITPRPFIAILVTAMVAAWMLSVTSTRIRSKYFMRVFFVAAIGLIVSLYGDLLQLDFGPQSKDYTMFLVVNDIITWILAGLVIGWRIKPRIE